MTTAPAPDLAPVVRLDDRRVPCPSCRRPMHRMQLPRRATTRVFRCEPCNEFHVLGIAPAPSLLWPGIALLACTAAVVLAVIVFTR